jgi:hypothetical protein
MITIVGPGFQLDPDDPTHVDTTSRSQNWSRGLSPFLIGPCDLYPGAACAQSKNMENAWQFAKVYPQFLDKDGNPGADYPSWARRGWLTERGIRYPMGKGAAPAYSFWDGKKLGYIEARKQIYIPLYSAAVQKTAAFEKLAGLYREHGKLVLRDFDGYDHRAFGFSLDAVINNPEKTMGHAFVLAMLLEKPQ